MSSVQIWLEIAKIIVGVVLAVVAGSITWRQYQAQRAKLELDLFDKRYAIFLKVWKACSVHVSGGHTLVQRTDAWRDVRNAVPEALFLFGPEIAEYIGKVDTMLVQFDEHDPDDPSPDPFENDRQVQAQREAVRWLATQASTGAREQFSFYLDFGQWSAKSSKGTPHPSS